MNPEIDCVFSGLGNIGAIYISNYSTANNFNLLISTLIYQSIIKNILDLNIKSVITIAKNRKINYPKNIVESYLYIDAEDS